MKKLLTLLLCICIIIPVAFSQDYDSCGLTGDDAWAGDTAAITAYLISCGRIDTTNYDEQGKPTTGKPHHQKISMKLNSGKELHNDSVYFLASEMPQYPGGDEALLEYFKANIKYPPFARAHSVEGKVIVSFIIDRTGTLTHLKIVRSVGAGCDEEALRVLRSMPKWKPGKVNGKEVRVQMNLPVKFQLG